MGVVPYIAVIILKEVTKMKMMISDAKPFKAWNCLLFYMAVFAIIVG